jgi:RHH-type rel operon transcriptional repressor/antitoxin RelB
MDAILTVRLDREIKERGQAILGEKGLTPSQAVQRLFDYVVQKGSLPFEDERRPSPEELEQRLAAFTRFHTKQPLALSDEEIRAARLGDRYGIDAGQ